MSKFKARIEENVRRKPIAKAMQGVLTRNILFQDALGKTVFLRDGTLIIVDILMLIAYAQGVHFTIERGEYRLIN